METFLHWLVSPRSLILFPILVAAWAGPGAMRSGARSAKRLLRRAGRHRLAGATLFLVAILLHEAIVLVRGVPEPRVHDEYSYLLAADTFARGRLTNPTPPSPAHFETFHVMLEPSYASKYPPGQGLLLALGTLVEEPAVGAWIGIGLAAAAMLWALRGWFSPTWSLAGALIFLFHPIAIGWAQSYWGGALAFAGGALLLGSAGRIRTRPAAMIAPTVAGLAILANTRPYEGLVAAVIFLVAVVCMWRKAGRPGVDLARGFLLPAAIAMVPVVLWMGYYNHRVTGNPWKMPYQAHAERYNAVSPFLFLPAPAAPSYSRKDLEALHAGYEKWEYESQRSWSGFAGWKATKLSAAFQEWFQFRLLFVAAVLILLLGRTRREIAWLGALGAFGAAMLPVTYFNLHYFAPIGALGLAVLVSGLRKAAALGRNRRLGELFVLGALVVGSATSVVGAMTAVQPERAFSRRPLENELRWRGGRHLVLMTCHHSGSCPVIHNAADFDSAPVVWAMSLGDERDRELLRHFPDRQPWRAVAREGWFDLELIPTPSDAPDRARG